MKTARKILQLFIEEGEPKTIRQIAKQIKADYKITYTATQRLAGQNILKTQTVGKSTVCTLNGSYYSKEIYEAQDERRKEALRNGDINQLSKELMSHVGTSFFVLLLFGSYAKGRHTKASDIDLLFISNEHGFEEKISAILSLIPLKTHAVVLSEGEFIRMKDAKKPNVVQEAMDGGMILYGIEAYYRMKNA